MLFFEDELAQILDVRHLNVKIVPVNNVYGLTIRCLNKGLYSYARSNYPPSVESTTPSTTYRSPWENDTLYFGPQYSDEATLPPDYTCLSNEEVNASPLIKKLFTKAIKAGRIRA